MSNSPSGQGIWETKGNPRIAVLENDNNNQNELEIRENAEHIRKDWRTEENVMIMNMDRNEVDEELYVKQFQPEKVVDTKELTIRQEVETKSLESKV